VRPERVQAFAPGRVNLIGEHTDYNSGLALPFALDAGVTVIATRLDVAGPGWIEAVALDLDEQDTFELESPDRPDRPGWRAFVRGAVAELAANGVPLGGARLEITGTLPQGAGLSSSAALSVALTTALIALTGAAQPPHVELARVCSRIEHDWVGARTGLLDQLASLAGQRDAATLIDFRTLTLAPVPMQLRGWQLVTLDSGERRTLAGSGYNDRGRECVAAAELMGARSLRVATLEAIQRLPEPLRSRALHVAGENVRVRRAAVAIQSGDMPALASLLNAGHESLRDLFEVSTDAVEHARRRLLDAGAAGAKLIGGGFGGSVLGLLEPSVPVPAGAAQVGPAAGARVTRLA